MNPTDVPGMHDMAGNGPVWGLVAVLMFSIFVAGYLTLTKVVSPMLAAMLAAIKEMSEAVNRNSTYLRRLMGFMQGRGDLDDLDSDTPVKR